MTQRDLSSADDAAHSAPPTDRDELLRRVGKARAAVYRVVRQVLDDLETATPWNSLYYPSDDHTEFIATELGLLERLSGMPPRIEKFLAAVRTEGSDYAELNRDDVEFYFAGIQSMVENDVERLRQLLEPLRERFVSTIEEKTFVCEVSADLKGKYSSALVATASNLIAEGRWSGAAIEVVLFPEKMEEARGNEQLVASLAELSEAIERLPEAIGIAELYGRWREGERADPYALADLHCLKGGIGCLLKGPNRRNLYSGDYHRIRRREALLSERLEELERLHRITWSGEVVALWERGEADFSRLTQLLLEVTAVLDNTVLAELVGEDWYQELRAMAEDIPVVDDDDGEPADAVGADADVARAALPSRWASLIPLLREEDLRTFLTSLRGSVGKRQSFVALLEAQAPQPVDGSTEEELDLDKLALETVEEMPEEGDEDAETGSSTVLAAEDDGEVVLESSTEPEELSLAQQQEAAFRLRERLEEVRAPNSAQWKAFRMTERLLSKHGRIPPGMFASARPFVSQVEEEVLPAVEGVLSFSALTAEHVEALRAYCRFLLAAEPSPARLRKEIPTTMSRLLHLLDAIKGLSVELDPS